MIGDIRPQRFEDFVGQKETIEYFKLKVDSYKLTGNPVGHSLILGPQGVGKTSLAHVVANELGSKVHTVSGPRLDTWDKVLSVLDKVAPNDVVFIDEVHNLKRRIQENLHDVLEDFKVNIFEGGGKEDIVPVSKELPRFSVFGATTHAGTLHGPLFDRFTYQPILTPYTHEQLELLVLRTYARIYETECPLEVAKRIAKLSCRSARRAVTMLQAYQEAQVVYPDMEPEKVMDLILRLGKIDPWLGLNYASRRYLSELVRHKKGGDYTPVGVEMMGALINEQPDTIKNIIEPFLLSNIDLDDQQGAMVEITSSGRKATALAGYYIYLCKFFQMNSGWFPSEIF